MNRKKQKLELTWIGKDQRPRLEPRILLEDTEKSYHAKERVTISLTTNDPSGFKATSSSIFSTINYIIIYAKNQYLARLNKIYIRKEYDSGYSKVLMGQG